MEVNIQLNCLVCILLLHLNLLYIELKKKNRKIFLILTSSSASGSRNPNYIPFVKAELVIIFNSNLNFLNK